MAVAAHVSRVSKEYAPHGFSVVQDMTASMAVPTGTTDDFYLPLVNASDGDIYLEAVHYAAITALESHGTNYWTMGFVYGASGLASETAIHSGHVGGASTVVGINTLTAVTITTPVVPQGNTLFLKCDANHASSPAETVGATVRYRRKA
tara:strand:+ start:423 stop:869 length:447 start_codon:yes stop_codon:yes gene_type:complete